MMMSTEIVIAIGMKHRISRREFSRNSLECNISFVGLRLSFFFLLLSSASQLSGMEAEEEAGSERVATYKVGMLGASEVGKTALTAQFTTSDYICAYDASLGKHGGCFYAYSPPV